MKDTAEKGYEKTFKTVCSTLARRLFNFILDNQQSVLEEAQFKKFIDYKQEYHVKSVVKIVDMLVVVPTIAVASRLIP